MQLLQSSFKGVEFQLVLNVFPHLGQTADLSYKNLSPNQPLGTCALAILIPFARGLGSSALSHDPTPCRAQADSVIGTGFPSPQTSLPQDLTYSQGVRDSSWLHSQVLSTATHTPFHLFLRGDRNGGVCYITTFQGFKPAPPIFLLQARSWLDFIHSLLDHP